MATALTFLMSRIAVAGYGIGAIHHKKNGIGNKLRKNDFSIILAIWAGEEENLLEGVSGTINYYFIDGVTEAANKYYGKMVDLHRVA